MSLETWGGGKLGLKVKSIVNGHNHDRKLSVIRTGSQFRNTPLGRLIIIQIYDEDFTKRNTERSPQDANVFKEEKDKIIKLPKTKKQPVS